MLFRSFTALAVTDHGTLAGTIYMQKALLAKGIKPILGIEAYVIFEDTKERKYEHATLLVKNETGWKNLLKLQEKAVRDHFYYKPRMLWSEIMEHHEGLILMTACMGGFLAKPFLEGYHDKVLDRVKEAKAVFKDDFYMELMPNRIPEQKKINSRLLDVADLLGIKCVVTTDSHYPNKEDVKMHKAIKAVALRKPYKESGFSDDTFYLLNGEDIKQLMEKHHYTIAERLPEFMRHTK